MAVEVTLRRSRVRSDMRPLLAIPSRTAVRSADSGATAAGFAETAVAAAAAARGARRRVPAAAAGEDEGQTRRVEDGGEGDGERRKGAKSSRAPSIADIPAVPRSTTGGLLTGVASRCGEASGCGGGREREGSRWVVGFWK
jgi:hypothetical protein